MYDDCKYSVYSYCVSLSYKTRNKTPSLLMSDVKRSCSKNSSPMCDVRKTIKVSVVL